MLFVDPGRIQVLLVSPPTIFDELDWRHGLKCGSKNEEIGWNITWQGYRDIQFFIWRKEYFWSDFVQSGASSSSNCVQCQQGSYSSASGKDPLFNGYETNNVNKKISYLIRIFDRSHRLLDMQLMCCRHLLISCWCGMSLSHKIDLLENFLTVEWILHLLSTGADTSGTCNLCVAGTYSSSEGKSNSDVKHLFALHWGNQLSWGNRV